VFATALLVLLVLAITDKQNMEPPKGMIPLVIGFVVLALLSAFESNCGAALNPARDLAPRVFTAMAGWKNVFRCLLFDQSLCRVHVLQSFA